MTMIHPTAIVDSQARLGDDVAVGAYCIIEADVEIGAGTVLRPNVIIRRHTTLGSGNFVDSFSVLGGEPQDFKFDSKTVSYLRIGDNNTFREGVTISRATGDRNATEIGSGTYWMAGAHAGHNAIIRDRVILVNGSAVAGHAEISPGAILSGHVLIHQFCWIGEMVMVQGNAALSMHTPPYVIASLPGNNISGLNVVGLRRAEHISDEDRRQVKEAFGITYRSNLSPMRALEKMDACTDWGKPADKFREFVRRVLAAEAPYNRGLCQARTWERRA